LGQLAAGDGAVGDRSDLGQPGRPEPSHDPSDLRGALGAGDQGADRGRAVPAGQDGQHGPGQGPQLLVDVAAVGHLDAALGRGLQGLGHQPGLAAPAPVHGGLVHPGAGRDGLHADLVPAPVGQLLEGGVEHRGAGAGGPPARPHAARLGHPPASLQLSVAFAGLLGHTPC
jgi:hypothetical protein